MVLAVGDFVYARSECYNFDLLAIFTVKCNDSVSFSFLFPCFLLR